MAADKQPHNVNALLLGTGEFSFAEGAATPAAAQIIGWLDFGNVTTFSIQAKPDKLEHKGSYRGTKRLDLTLFKELTGGYQIKFDEVDANKVAALMYGTAGSNYTQVIRTAAAADAITPVIGRWHDLLIGAVRVRELTVVAASAGVEDTDYIVDYKTGRIRALTVTGFGTLTLTAPAILITSANTFKKITPLNKPSRKGMGRLTIWNNDGSLVLDHYDFYCEIFPEGDASIGDKETELTFTLNLLTVGEVGAVQGALQA